MPGLVTKAHWAQAAEGAQYECMLAEGPFCGQLLYSLLLSEAVPQNKKAVTRPGAAPVPAHRLYHGCCSLLAVSSLRSTGSIRRDPDQHPAPTGTLSLLGQGCRRRGPVPPPALQQEPSDAEEHLRGAKHPQLHLPGAVPRRSVLPEGDGPRWPVQVLITLCHRVDM